MSWVDRSLPDTMVWSIQTFDGAVYARAFNTLPSYPFGFTRLYKYGAVVVLDEEGLPSRFGWAATPDGMELLFEENEIIQEIQTFNQIGKSVQTDIDGNFVRMTHLAAGPYFFRLITNRRLEVLKMYWPGQIR